MSPARRAALAILAAGFAFAATEGLHRLGGASPAQQPGWMLSEYLDRLHRIDPANDTVFVGDSRVGWGVADQIVSQSMQRGKAINLGLAATSVTFQLNDILKTFPAASGRIVINYSAASFFTFTGGFQSRYPETLAEDIDQRIADWFSRNFASAHSSPVRILWRKPPAEDWGERTVFPEGFVNATLTHVTGHVSDPARHQLDYYRTIIAGLKTENAARRLLEIKTLVDRIRQRGWTVSMIALPTGERMREVESAIPHDLGAASVARYLGLSLADFSADPRFPTQDESHLSPQGAIAIAPLLGSIH